MIGIKFTEDGRAVDPITNEPLSSSECEFRKSITALVLASVLPTPTHKAPEATQ